MIRFGDVIIRSDIRAVLDPRHSALLVYDGLRHNLERPGHAAPIAETWPQVVAAARGAGVPVIYTRHRPVGPRASGAWLRYRMRVTGVGRPELLPELAAAPGAYEIGDSVAPASTDTVLDKDVNSAFQGTQLASMLREREVETIVLTGIATESGIETTARESLAKGFYCVVVSDCVSSTNTERHHASMAAMARFADIVTAAELKALWSTPP